MPNVGEIPGTIDDRLAELAGVTDGPLAIERAVLEDVKAGRIDAADAPGEIYVRQAEAERATTPV